MIASSQLMIVANQSVRGLFSYRVKNGLQDGFYHAIWPGVMADMDVDSNSCL